MTHPTSTINDDVHQRVRLGILAILNGAARADFRYLRETLGVTDGNLGRHLQVLEEAGFISVEKVFEDRKPRTWVKITRAGRSAFQDEVQALQAIVAALDQSDASKRSLTLGAGGETK